MSGSQIDCDYKYSLLIEDWPLPFIELISGIGGEEEDGEKNPMLEMIKAKVKDVIGDVLLKVAQVEVSWPEGSRKNSVELTYLLTAQRKADEFIETLKNPEKKSSKAKPKGGKSSEKEKS